MQTGRAMVEVREGIGEGLQCRVGQEVHGQTVSSGMRFASAFCAARCVRQVRARAFCARAMREAEEDGECEAVEENEGRRRRPEGRRRSNGRRRRWRKGRHNRITIGMPLMTAPCTDVGRFCSSA
eukprot:5487468-Pyramimonas_sp.AAC.1